MSGSTRQASFRTADFGCESMYMRACTGNANGTMTLHNKRLRRWRGHGEPHPMLTETRSLAIDLTNATGRKASAKRNFALWILGVVSPAFARHTIEPTLRSIARTPQATCTQANLTRAQPGSSVAKKKTESKTPSVVVLQFDTTITAIMLRCCSFASLKYKCFEL